MLTKEFISEVKILGYHVIDKGTWLEVCEDKEHLAIIYISKDEQYQVQSFLTGTDRQLSEELFEVAIEYAKTPIEERTMQLTDAERVILENLPQEFVNISRNSREDLYILGEIGNVYYISIFDNLFQFVRNGKPHSIKELLG